MNDAVAAGDTGNPYVKLELVTDGFEVLIDGVRNLSIETNGAFTEDTAEIVVEPRYANVLNFLDCDRIILADLVLGHTPEKGYCTGGVLHFTDCGRVAMADLDLYGCGTYGIIAERCASIQTVDSVIRDCSYGLLDMTQVADAGFGGCVFRDCSGFTMIGLRGGSVSFSSCEFVRNTWDEGWCHFLSLREGSAAVFLDCTFDRPAYFDLTGDSMTGQDVTIKSPVVVD